MNLPGIDSPRPLFAVLLKIWVSPLVTVTQTDGSVITRTKKDLPDCLPRLSSKLMS